jgi:Rrf2 family cysteine metabolism transcriptional repressor
MTLLSRKADYALLILSYLHNHSDGGNARAIAEAFGLSRPFVANILKELCQKGFVASHRGVKGGYAILRPLGSVTLAELLESIDEGFRLTLCSNGPDGQNSGEACSFESACTIKGPLAEIHRRLMDVLRSTTLADIMKSDGVDPAVRPLLTSLTLRESCCSAPATEPAATT